MNVGGFFVEEGPLGPQIVVTGAWDPRLAELMQKESVRGLVLNYARGWKGSSLQILSDTPFLEAVQIINWELDDDLSPIEGLSRLRSLRLACNSHYKLDFRYLPSLESCSVSWEQASASIFDCSSLHTLYLKDYTESDSESLAKLQRLQELVLTDAKVVGVRALGRLAALKRLALQGLLQLKSLSGLEQLNALEDLEITQCLRVKRVEELSSLARLRKLVLNDDGPIESLQPVEPLVELDWLVFAGTTEILDGDLSCLLRMPSLRTTAFKDRPHYSHTRREIQKELKARRS